MSVLTQRLTDFSQIAYLYNTRLKRDFPKNELKSLDAMQRSWLRDAYDCYGLVDGNNVLGYAFFVRRGRDYLLDYLAIVEGHRDEGLGSLFIRQLTDCIQGADCVVCEVEDPEKAEDGETRRQRDRRRQFYLKNGYRETELTSTVFGVNYRILEIPTGTEHTDEQLCAAYTGLYRSTLPDRFFRTEFKVFLNKNSV